MEITFEQLDPKLQREILDTIQSHPAYRQAMLQLQQARANNDYVKVFQLSKKLDEMKQASIQACIHNQTEELVQLKDLFDEMSEEQRSKVILYTNAICFYCDMIDSLSVDMNSILAKLKGHPTVHMYDKIITAGKEASNQMKFMADNTHMDFQKSFASIADEVNEMVFNKVNKLDRIMKNKQFSA